MFDFEEYSRYNGGMKYQDFKTNSDELLSHCQALLFKKADEYASEDDRLSNFKKVNHLMECQPSTACWWFALKHIDSISTTVKDIEKGKLPTKEYLLEKLGDSINYHMLLYNCILEEIDSKAPSRLSDEGNRQKR